MLFLNMKICSVVSLLGRKPACSSMSFDFTSVRILSITILPMTLLTTDSSVIPRQFLRSFGFPFFGSLTISPFLHFLAVYSLLHSMSIISLTLVLAWMSASSSSVCMLSILGAFQFFLTSALLGSDVSISSISCGSSISISLTELLGFSVKCSNHLFVLLSFSLIIVLFLFITAALCQGLLLLNTLVRVFSVFTCCCSAPFSASSATHSVYLRLLSLARLLTSLSFSRYSSCNLCFSLSDVALLLFVTEALLSYNLMVDQTR